MPNDLQSDLSRLVARIEREDAPLAAADPYRPYFHLAPPVGWMNDPNGLCRCGEWYHVFYQYGPFDPEGGVKHWGHYRSRDLLRWEKCPVLLFPSDTWDLHGVFSGSALVEDGVMYLYYTGNVLSAGAHDYITSGRGHNTALAVCRDGLTAETNELLMENRDYPAGLSCHVRDPKVWAQDGRYYMVQGARTLDDRGEVLVFESTDKRRWTHINTIRTPAPFGYMWECPDYFEIDGKGFLSTCPQGMPHYETKWQNLNESGYFPVQGKLEDSVLGDFTEWDMGFDFYAPQTFLDPQGRRILIGWLGMDNKVYGNATTELGWQHCLTIPRVVTIAPNGKLRQQPIAEFDELKSNARRQSSGQTAEYPLPFELDGEPADSFSISLDGKLELGFDKEKKLFTMKFTDEKYGCGRTVRNAEIDSVRNIRVIADMSSSEVYINDGETVMSTRIYPDNDSVKLTVNGFEAQVSDI